MGNKDLSSLSDAADAVGMNRNTLARWVKAGKLKAETGYVRNLQTTLVSLADVRRLVGEGIGPGRPPAAKPRKGKGRAK
jgi:transposase-like protein